MNRFRPAQGFTLIEVMIAILIMSLISVISWRALDTVQRSDVQLQARAEQSGQLLRVVQQLEQDVTMRATVELPASLLSRRTAQRAFELEIIRAAPAQAGHWQRVQWWTADGLLYRAAGPATDRLPLVEPARSDAVAVLDGVEALEVRAWMPGQGWTPLPYNGQVQAAATGLEVVLRRAADGREPHVRRAIALD